MTYFKAVITLAIYLPHSLKLNLTMMNLRKRLISRSSLDTLQPPAAQQWWWHIVRIHSCVKTYDFASRVFAEARAEVVGNGGHWQANNKRSRYCDVEVGGEGGEVGRDESEGGSEGAAGGDEDGGHMEGVSCQTTQRRLQGGPSSWCLEATDIACIAVLVGSAAAADLDSN